MTLPIRSDSLPAGRLRLTRRFNRPPRAPSASVVLRFAQTPGISSVTLNGLPIGTPSPGCSEFDLSLGPLEPTNELSIEVEVPRGEGEWGIVSLAFN